MKKVILCTGLLFALGFLTSCEHDNIRASAEVSSLDYAIPAYSKLRVSNAFNIYVSFSDTEESIRIEANDNIHDKVIVKKDGTTLLIKLKNFTSIRGNDTLNAYIVTKDIESFEISGASRLSLHNEWISSDGTIKLSGASEFNGEVTIDQLKVDMSGASEVDIFGSVDDLDAHLSGSSDLKNYDLEVQQLSIDLNGASDAYLTVSEQIDVEASGASTLYYKGDAVINRKRLSGASEIIKK